MNQKKEYHIACIEFIQTRIQSIEASIKAIQHDLGAETKSSAGDKYETSREMMNQEESKLKSSLNLLTQQLHVLQNMELFDDYKVGLGAVVETNKGMFFISVALGVVKTEFISFFAISTEAPIYSELKNKTVGDKIRFNGNEFLINKIL